MSDGRLQELCERIYSTNQHVRFAGVITKMGRLVAGGMRPDLESLEDKEDSSKLYVQFALMTEMRKDFDSTFGKAIYSFTEREKIKLASFPLDDNHILRVSIEKEEKDHAQIIQGILDIIGTPILS
ncbi:MAG: hypothetical protein GEU26_15905 [Nitrososphaeraceae archaeon]|nr:hypothetical protein [Nitrososphaeraceae archaeon]